MHVRHTDNRFLHLSLIHISFIETLKKISKENDVDFYVSISATNEQLGNVDFENCTLLN